MDFFLLLALYALLGSVAGLTAGLLGVGGGLIIVPALSTLFALQGVPAGIVMQLALGTSLATIVFTSLSSMRAHHRRGAVNRAVMLQLSAGILAGGWLGGVLAVWIGGAVLTLLFGMFELLIAALILIGKHAQAHQSLPRVGRNLIAGGAIGIVSALLGIGGGSLTVPYLLWHRLDMRTAVGTSSACGFTIALAGACGFVLAGWSNSGLPSGSSGFVFWPAVIGISITSVPSAPIGAWLAHKVDQDRLEKVFALFLAGLGIWMIGKGVVWSE